jgi:hypothetical protein
MAVREDGRLGGFLHLVAIDDARSKGCIYAGQLDPHLIFSCS